MLFEKIEAMYRQQVYRRADENGCVFYFSYKDFEGLHQMAYPFTSTKGHKLQGYFYYYENYREDRLVLFEHGMGSGHRGYMREIEMLAKQGYLVFAYDHTGCMESGGETTGGFVQSLIDLNDAVNALKAHELYGKWDISVMGHSWGGFSTMNIGALHPDISHVVAMSGFCSVEAMLSQAFGGILSFAGKKLYKKEQQANPEYIGYHAAESLKKFPGKALLIHSEDDKVVRSKKHFDVIKKELGDRPNIQFLKVNGKGHNPNYTEDAVKYKDAFFADYQRMLKEKKLNTEEEKRTFISKYDWKRMTEQDSAVWKVIFDFLDN